MTDKAPDLAETQSEFARRLGKRKSYISQLKSAGRLVMTEDGKRVVVQASIERIAATMDPSKAAVADRHAAARTAKAPPPIDDSESEEPRTPPPATDPAYQRNRAEREGWLALAAKRDYLESMRKLLPIVEVDHALQTAVAEFRARVERMPDVLAPQLAAESDEARCRTMLRDEVEQALTDLSRSFGLIAKAAE